MTINQTPFRFVALGLCLFFALPVVPALAQATIKQTVPSPLRDLPKDRPYELRVLYVEDHRLPTLSVEQRRELYGKIETLLDRWYGYTVKLREVNRRGLTEHFAAHEAWFARQAARIRAIDIDLTAADGAERLRFAIARDFRPRALTQIERYLKGGPLESKSVAGQLAAQQFTERLAELRAILCLDGQPWFDPAQARLGSYGHWVVLNEEMTEADLVVTNSMILGADSEMSIYVIARGGLTTGTTDNNIHNAYQGTMGVGLLPFLSDAPVFLRERGRIPAVELLDTIATFCMHEMGHFFLRYAEHYDHPHCVHVAPTGLNYYEWHKAIREQGPCTLEHRKVTRF